MFSQAMMPFQTNPTMHLTHLYGNRFAAVVDAFLCKYNSKNKFCTTTICHVEQLNDDEFQFVRRMENVVSSKPLYEKIIVNRKDSQMHGYTFEHPKDKVYSEHYTYECQGEETRYNMYLFRDPGLKKMLRSRIHNWGVQNTVKLIETRQMLSEKKDMAVEKMTE